MASRRAPELRFVLDFEAQPPAMTSAALGIDKVSYRSSEPLCRDITVFDATDERLLRAGVVVAHRRTAGVGEWYLAAPTWHPRLPDSSVEPLNSSGGLPESFRDMIRPLARRAPLGPVAALDCDRHGYVLRAADGSQLGTIMDEKVTLRRGEAIRGRYREVTVAPEAAMTSQQSAHVVDAIQQAGGTRVDTFPTLQQRLGAPATGLTDFPHPRPLHRHASMEELVSAVFAADLRALTELLLDAVRDKRPHVASLNALLESVRRDVRGLAHVLEPAWREEVEALMEGVPHERLADATSTALGVSEALVCEVRAPKLGDVGQEEAAPLLLHRAQQAALIMAERCGALTTGSPDQQWEAALGAAEVLAVSAAVAEPVLGKPLRRIARRLQAVTEHLRACTGDGNHFDVDLSGLSVEEAFALGARSERGRATTLTERERFVARWPHRLDELRRLLQKAKRSG